MKTIKDKQVLVGADFAAVALKDAVVKHLEERGWTVTDLGVQADDMEHAEMYHRVGLKVGSKIAEGEFERALLFCGTGMGIHIAASKCPHVHAAVCESVNAAKRSVTANNCNVLAMGAFFLGAKQAMAMADAFLENNLGDGYEEWDGFYAYHKLAYDELEAFDYEAYKANGFEVVDKKEAPLAKEPKGFAY